MNFTQAISSGFQNYFNFQGRSSKSAFWFWMLFVVIYAVVGGFLLGMMGFNDAVIDSAILIILLPVIIPGISLTARRYMILINLDGCNVFLFQDLWQMNF